MTEKRENPTIKVGFKTTLDWNTVTAATHSVIPTAYYMDALAKRKIAIIKSVSVSTHSLIGKP